MRVKLPATNVNPSPRPPKSEVVMTQSKATESGFFGNLMTSVTSLFSGTESVK